MQTMPHPEQLQEHFQFEMLRISNHTAFRSAEKTRFFPLGLGGRRCAAASRFTFFKAKTLKRRGEILTRLGSLLFGMKRQCRISYKKFFVKTKNFIVF